MTPDLYFALSSELPYGQPHLPKTVVELRRSVAQRYGACAPNLFLLPLLATLIARRKTELRNDEVISPDDRELALYALCQLHEDSNSIQLYAVSSRMTQSNLTEAQSCHWVPERVVVAAVAAAPPI